MNIQNSNFSITSPFTILDRWLHPFRHKINTLYRDKNLRICWTNKAATTFQKRDIPLIAEMKIYFSCVVQKCVLFHDQTELVMQTINNLLKIMLQPVQAASCGPAEFADNHPISYEYTSTAASKLRPSELNIDFKKGQWIGSFMI